MDPFIAGNSPSQDNTMFLSVATLYYRYRQFTDLKHKYPNMKTLLAVGGWNHGGDPFSKMTATAEGRSEFVRTTVEFLRKYSFDGLDVDWEYPKAKDKQNLVSLIQVREGGKNTFTGRIKVLKGSET